MTGADEHTLRQGSGGPRVPSAARLGFGTACGKGNPRRRLEDDLHGPWKASDPGEGRMIWG